MVQYHIPLASTNSVRGKWLAFDPFPTHPALELYATVRAAPIAQRQTGQYAQWEEEDGTEYSQTGIVVLQHADAAHRAPVHDNDLVVDDFRPLGRYGLYGYLRYDRYRALVSPVHGAVVRNRSGHRRHVRMGGRDGLLLNVLLSWVGSRWGC